MNERSDESATLYVGNLPFSTTQEELTELFEQAGAVESVRIPMDWGTSRPRGFAFVQMADAEGMQKAVEMFNGYTLGGRELVVNQARPREDRGDRPPRRF